MKRLLSIFLITITCFLLNFSVVAAEPITSIDDLEYLEKTSSDQASILGTNASLDNHIIIIYKDDTNTIADLNLDDEIVEAGRSLDKRADVIKVSDSVNTDVLINELNENDNVEAVGYDILVEALDIPNDRYYPYQSYYSLISFDNVWKNIGNYSVKVAVLDTGVFSLHEDLVGRINRDGYNFITNSSDTTDKNGHGTMVAGIIAANTNNGIGVSGLSGLNNKISITPYVVLDSNGTASLSTIVEGILAVADRSDIKIVNLSLGLVEGTSNKGSSILKAAIQSLINNDKLVVAASGNSNQPYLVEPAAYDGVVAVGGINDNQSRATSADWGAGFGSNYGVGLNLVAPGTRIASTDINNKYSLSSGTSFSTPMVSATAALMLSINPNLTATQITNILYTTAKDLGPTGYDLEYGYGLLQVDKAINAVQQSNQTQLPSNTNTNNGNYSLQASAHVQDLGWLNPVGNNIVAGTTGRALQLEALKLTDNNPNLNITAQAHVQNVGDTAEVSEGNIIGTTGQGNGMEAVRIYLQGNDASNYNVFYRVHVKNYGWTEWTRNGNWAGTKGKNLQLEAVQVVVTDSNSFVSSEPSNVNWTFMS